MQLDLFREIEGKSGEELASALLRFLLVNSSLFRQLLAQRLAITAQPHRTPSFRSGVYCQTEYQTASADGTGRIDVLVADNDGLDANHRFTFVLAIEVKLWAAFTYQQPAKYWPALLQLVGKESDRCAVVVLAPDSRRDEVNQHLRQQAGACPATAWGWDALRGDLEKVAAADGPEMSMVARWFLRYLETALGSFRLLGEAGAYVGKHVLIGNPYHIDFLYKLKSLLPNPSRIGGRPTYYGLRCTTADEQLAENGVQPARVWVGFVKHEDEVIFGIDTPLPARPSPPAGEFAIWNRRFLQVPFDETIATAQAWAALLRERLAAIQAELERGGHALAAPEPDGG